MATTNDALETVRHLRKALERGKISHGGDVDNFFIRDSEFLERVVKSVELNESDSLRNSLDEFRNLSQGFGAYCDDIDEVDRWVDLLYGQVKSLLLGTRVGPN